MNTKSLRFRITLWYVGLLATALLMFGSAVYFGLERLLNQQLNESLVKQARTIGDEILVDFASRGTHYAVTEIDESYEPEVNASFIRVTQESGGFTYVSPSPRDGSFDSAKIASASDEDRNGYPPRLIPGDGRPMVIQGLRYETPSGNAFLIETGAPYQLIAAQLRSARLAMILGIPVFLLLAVAGGLVLVRKSLQPLRAITEQAERISSENISQRLPVAHTGDEVERLSLSLNKMIERLEQAIQHISRFSADVSHELRTPLTILRGELETLAQQRSGDPESIEMIGNSLEEIDRLGHIVDQLLVISRLDAGQAGIERVPVDLGRLAEVTAEQMRLLSDEKSIAVKFSIEPGVLVSGDRMRLKQILVNLLDNAIKYVPDKGTIEVSVCAEAGRGLLAVSDTGIGISPTELPFVFDRFYRADKARRRATGGAGLGLSIVKAIALAHDGKVSVISTEGVGTRVSIELPLAGHDSVLEPRGQVESPMLAGSRNANASAELS